MEENEGDRPVFEIPLLQDLNHYLEQHGIIPGRAAEDVPNIESRYQRQDQVEFEQNVNEQLQYQSEVIDRFVKEDEAIEKDERKSEEQNKKDLLDRCKHVFMSIQASDDIIHNVSLYHMVEQCDIFRTLVSSDKWSFHEDYTFQLNGFRKENVLQFINIVMECHNGSDVRSFLSNDSIIECVYIAHYLQATDILNEITEIMQCSIDSENCTSICALADELQLPSLRQASMKYVMECLDKIQENEDVWNDIPLSLKNQILTLRNATNSSIIGRGQTKEVIFSSSSEFLAIFHDTLTSHKERLREAKERQEEIIQERLKESNGGGRFTRRFVQERDVYGGSVEDAAKKIQKQEQRLKTLQAFYNEQKAIFSRDVESEGRVCGHPHRCARRSVWPQPGA